MIQIHKETLQTIYLYVYIACTETLISIDKDVDCISPIPTAIPLSNSLSSTKIYAQQITFCNEAEITPLSSFHLLLNLDSYKTYYTTNYGVDYVFNLNIYNYNKWILSCSQNNIDSCLLESIISLSNYLPDISSFNKLPYLSFNFDIPWMPSSHSSYIWVLQLIDDTSNEDVSILTCELVNDIDINYEIYPIEFNINNESDISYIYSLNKQCSTINDDSLNENGLNLFNDCNHLTSENRVIDIRISKNGDSLIQYFSISKDIVK